jgi:hypothetical protein
VLFLTKARASLITAILFGSFLLVAPLPASALGTVVQQASGGCNPCAGDSSTAVFVSPVTSGNLIVVGVSAFYSSAGGPYTASVSDSLSPTFTQAANICNTGAYANCAAIFYATATASGADTVTVTANNGRTMNNLDIFVYELNGLTTVGATTGTGQSAGTAISTASTTFGAGAFLLSVLNVYGATTFTVGAGFTASAPSTNSMQGFAEYALSGVASPTTFPATIGSTNSWAAVGIALVSTTPPPAPNLTPTCPSTFGGSFMLAGATFMDGFGNTWVAPGGSANGGTYSSYFFPGLEGNIPPPMLQGWGGTYGTYGGQQGWIISFYCA